MVDVTHEDANNSTHNQTTKDTPITTETYGGNSQEHTSKTEITVKVLPSNSTSVDEDGSKCTQDKVNDYKNTHNQTHNETQESPDKATNYYPKTIHRQL
jgi:hypothetical protein